MAREVEKADALVWKIVNGLRPLAKEAKVYGKPPHTGHEPGYPWGLPGVCSGYPRGQPGVCPGYPQRYAGTTPAGCRQHARPRGAVNVIFRYLAGLENVNICQPTALANSSFP